MTHRANHAGPWAAAAVRLAAVWLLAGAFFKLFRGTPADLPPLIQALPLGLETTYRLAIGIELLVGGTALLRPALAWPALVAVFATFDAILIAMAMSGEASCGCFGSSVKIPPLAMLSIDSALLLAMLIARPWRMDRSAGARWALPLAAAAAVVLPLSVDRSASAAGGPGAASALPQYVILEVEKWVGRPVAETPLADWLDVGSLPQTGLWTFYRQTCEHCAEHLFELAAEDDGSRAQVLIRVPDPGDTPENSIIEVKPEGDHVTEVSLPEGIDWVISTPAEIDVEKGVIRSARQGIR